MEQFERIRRDARDEGLSVRELARRHRVHRRTVRQALAAAVPPPRRTPARARPATGPWTGVVRGWLEKDRDVPRKQRHTARRVWQRLVAEHGAQVSESSVRRLVAELRRELGAQQAQVAVPQTHPAGDEGEVDFGEFHAVIGGSQVKLWMFVMRLSHSGKAVHVAYANQAQESFMDGHVVAFERFGGVPSGRIRYDNLKPAVIAVLLGRERLENQAFVALRSHYGFDSFYCLPGIEGAHEKGGVEGEVGRFRRRHLVPVPDFASLAELNAHMERADALDDERRIAGRRETVGESGRRDLAALRPPPAEPFDPARSLSCRVDGKARICVRQCYYSVPARYAGRRVQVRLGAAALTVVADGAVVARHTRSIGKHCESLELDHYLEVLARKPGALPGSTALAQARASGAFTAVHQRYWDAARRALGDAAGTRALIEVLLLHRGLGAADLEQGMLAAMRAGRFDGDVVAVEARCHQQSMRVPPAPVPRAPVDVRPQPALDRYDLLIGVGP